MKERCNERVKQEEKEHGKNDIIIKHHAMFRVPKSTICLMRDSACPNHDQKKGIQQN